MKTNVLIFFVIFLLLPDITVVAQDSLVEWNLVQENAAWKPRDSQGEVVFNGYMWIFGGWHNLYEAPPRHVWRSKDGKNWELVSDKVLWKHNDLPMSLVFNGKIWMIGGWSDKPYKNWADTRISTKCSS